MGSEELVWSVIRDLENSRLDEKEKVLFRFITKVNGRCAEITAADMQPLHDAGWNDEALYFAVSVCALFNFYNRWVDATGVHVLSPEGHREGGRRTATHGYVRK